MANIYTKKTKIGQGVFADKNFRAGEKVLDFNGVFVEYKDVPPIVVPEDDRYVQVGINTYMGPSGNPDDLVNHSCNPNSGLTINGKNVVLVSIHEIKEGEEITFDYSTTMYDNPYMLRCKCGEKICRKTIKEFKHLPQSIKEKYVALGIIPDYILSSLIYKQTDLK